jgi:hypothetical protein
MWHQRDVALETFHRLYTCMAEQLLAALSSVEIAEVNINGIHNLSLDVDVSGWFFFEAYHRSITCHTTDFITSLLLHIQLCEQFSQQCPIAEPGDPRFQNLFIAVSQIVELFLTWDWVNYLDPVVRDKKYGHVPIGTVIFLLERCVVQVFSLTGF